MSEKHQEDRSEQGSDESSKEAPKVLRDELEALRDVMRQPDKKPAQADQDETRCRRSSLSSWPVTFHELCRLGLCSQTTVQVRINRTTGDLLWN